MFLRYSQWRVLHHAAFRRIVNVFENPHLQADYSPDTGEKRRNTLCISRFKQNQTERCRKNARGGFINGYSKRRELFLLAIKLVLDRRGKSDYYASENSRRLKCPGRVQTVRENREPGVNPGRYRRCVRGGSALR